MTGPATAPGPDRRPAPVTSPSSARAWAVERHRGSAAALHDRALPDPPRRTVWWLEPEAPALVLGSTQRDELVDRAAAAAAGVDVARRRSGGGVVLLDPGDVVWADVLVPPGDPLWDDDVVRSAWWVGEAWGRALADLGVAAEVHHGSLACGPYGRLVCFAGVGSGEVTAGDAKVVGVSQRRGRQGARFQCAVLLAWRPERLAGLLALDPTERAELVRAIAPAASGLADLGVGVDRAAVEAAFERHLPR